MIPEGRRSYYVYLEELRRSGVTNMYGASPYLASAFGLTNGEAQEILAEWMKNYDRNDYKEI